MLRVLDISPVNWAILALYVWNLVRLSLNFRRLYAGWAFGTTALTNVLLLGLSDTLAQSLRSAAQHRAAQAAVPDEEPALLRYVLDHGRQREVWLDEAGDDLAEMGLAEPSVALPGNETTTGGSAVGGLGEALLSGSLLADLLGDEVAARLRRVRASLTDFDFRRLALFSAWGFLVSFAQSPWYNFLRTAYRHDAKLVLVVQRVLADQLFYSPLMLSLFLLYLAVVVEQQPLAVVRESAFWLRYVRTLGVNLCVWPAAQFVNFLLVPSAAQIPFSSSLSVLWNTYLSLNTK